MRGWKRPCGGLLTTTARSKRPRQLQGRFLPYTKICPPSLNLCTINPRPEICAQDTSQSPEQGHKCELVEGHGEVVLSTVVPTRGASSPRFFLVTQLRLLVSKSNGEWPSVSSAQLANAILRCCQTLFGRTDLVSMDDTTFGVTLALSVLCEHMATEPGEFHTE